MLGTFNKNLLGVIKLNNMFATDFNIKGKNALITGAARGIGKSIALLFAEKGANVLILDIAEKEMNNVNIKIKEKYGQEVSSKAIKADITDKNEVEEAVNEFLEEFETIDILVNNAGVVHLDKAEKLGEEEWDETIDVNLKGPFITSQIVGKKMIEQNKGKIVNLASQAAITGLDQHAAYCASKSGIVGLTNVLALEWAKYNINVNAVSPTVVMTDLGEKAWSGEKGEKMKEKIPMGRFVQPEEVAMTVLFLASEASNMITGENFLIDGGYTIDTK